MLIKLVLGVVDAVSPVTVDALIIATAVAVVTVAGIAVRVLLLSIQVVQEAPDLLVNMR